MDKKRWIQLAMGAMAFLAAGSLVYIFSIDKKETQAMSRQHEERTQLERQYEKEREEILEQETRLKEEAQAAEQEPAYVMFGFDSTDESLYSSIYPKMKEYGYTGTIILSASEASEIANADAEEEKDKKEKETENKDKKNKENKEDNKEDNEEKQEGRRYGSLTEEELLEMTENGWEVAYGGPKPESMDAWKAHITASFSNCQMYYYDGADYAQMEKRFDGELKEIGITVVSASADSANKYQLLSGQAHQSTAKETTDISETADVVETTDVDETVDTTELTETTKLTETAETPNNTEMIFIQNLLLSEGSAYVTSMLDQLTTASGAVVLTNYQMEGEYSRFGIPMPYEDTVYTEVLDYVKKLQEDGKVEVGNPLEYLTVQKEISEKADKAWTEYERFVSENAGRLQELDEKLEHVWDGYGETTSSGEH